MPQNIINFSTAKQDRNQPVSSFPLSEALRTQPEDECKENWGIVGIHPNLDGMLNDWLVDLAIEVEGGAA